MQSYLTLARRYRPQVFADIIGQEHVLKVLRNAIANDRLPHAILLYGTRGIGKTTIARLIAKSVKCERAIEKPIVEFCNMCKQCDSITNSSSVDVLEMDAASHTGVTEIRELIEGVMYKPLTGGYQVYIIDEVHMLSTSAFNALLKTIEEPPPLTLFIFATTEISKIPLTILSRCCRLNLLPVSVDQLFKYYSDILMREDIEFESGAVSRIAKMAHGSIRDGLSLLDACMALAATNDYKEGRQLHRINNHAMLLESDVVSMQVDEIEVVLLELLNAVLECNIHNALDCLDRAIGICVDGVIIVEKLLDIIANIYRVKSGAMESCEFSIEIIKIAEKAELNSLLLLWDVVSSGWNTVKNLHGQRNAVEMLIFKMLYSVKKN